MTAQSKITQQLDRISQLFHSKKPYFLPMTETPEWFQIPDSPEPEPQRPRRITLKVALMTAPLLLIGGAVVFAENGNEGDDQPNVPTLTATTNTHNTQSTVSTSATTASDKVNRANETIVTTSKASVSKKINNVKKTVVTVNSSATTKNTVVDSAPNSSTGSGGGIKNPGLPNGKDSDHGGLDRHKRPEGSENHQEGGEHQIIGGQDD